MSDFAPIFAGWNVWAVWQAKDLSFDVMLVGLSRERRLRMWVEAVAEHAGANVSDPLALRGSQVELLNAAPDLTALSTRAETGGNLALLAGPADLEIVRFFNRGSAVNAVWPHDSDYMLEAVYQPSATNPATSGPPPAPILDTGAIAQGVEKAAKGATIVVGVAGLAAFAIWLAFRQRTAPPPV